MLRYVAKSALFTDGNDDMSDIELPYPNNLSDLAASLQSLPGFTWLDSGATDQLHYMALCPEHILRAADYASPDIWMSELERQLRGTGTRGSSTTPLANNFTGIAIGAIDFETTAGLITHYPQSPSFAEARIYRQVLEINPCQQTCVLRVAPTANPQDIELIRDALGQVATCEEPTFTLKSDFKPLISIDNYRKSIEAIHAYIRAGDCYQINYAYPFKAQYEGSLWKAYRTLRDVMAGPFSCFMPLTSHHLLSLSPERFLTVRNGRVTTQPIKGTRPRSAVREDDDRLAKELLNSAKDRAENVMITDLLRNDLSRWCEPGSVDTTELCALYSYRNVHHLVSRIEGVLRPDVTSGQMLLACSPGGSITGAPKKRAIDIIQALEIEPRGFYCGSIFAMWPNGDLDSNIAIRTLEAHQQQLRCWAGGGITIDSEVDAEYQETLDKVGPMLTHLNTTV
jgi:para-aminobenzoate synthetase component 1